MVDTIFLIYSILFSSIVLLSLVFVYRYLIKKNFSNLLIIIILNVVVYAFTALQMLIIYVLDETGLGNAMIMPKLDILMVLLIYAMSYVYFTVAFSSLSALYGVIRWLKKKYSINDKSP